MGVMAKKTKNDGRHRFAGLPGSKIVVFLPEELETTLKKTAKKNGRSIRGEVRHIVAKAYGFRLEAVS